MLGTDPPEAGPLTVAAWRWHSGRLLVCFAEVVDRTDAESLRGVLLTVDAAEVPLPQDPDEFHDHQLTGLTVVTVSGELVGTVSDVLHSGQDLLSITPAAGTSRQGEVLVPFVAAIAVEVDLAAGKVVIDPPPGLLDLAPDGAGPDNGAGPSPGDSTAGASRGGGTPGPSPGGGTAGLSPGGGTAGPSRGGGTPGPSPGSGSDGLSPDGSRED